jgi:hypothetical protein
VYRASEGAASTGGDRSALRTAGGPDAPVTL